MVNTLPHTRTLCNKLQLTVIHLLYTCNTPATHLQHTCNTLATHLQHTCNTLAACCNTLATRCNTLATHCNTPAISGTGSSSNSVSDLSKYVSVWEWTQTYVWPGVSVCVKWSHSRVWYDSLMCVTHSICRTCYAQEWVMSHMWMSHVAHVNESCRSCEWVISQMWMSQVMCDKFIHICNSHSYVRRMYVTRKNESHIWMSVAHIIENQTLYVTWSVYRMTGKNQSRTCNMTECVTHMRVAHY